MDEEAPHTKKQKLTVLDALILDKSDDFKLVRLTYISKPTRTLSEEEKQDLLTVAKRRNASMNITGILFLAEDLYMQTLEGPRSHILELLNRLNKDGRHTQLTITSIEYIETRIYPKWSMERVVLSEDSLFIMNNLFNTIVSSFDVLRTYSQQSVILDWLTNKEKKSEETETEKKEETKVEQVILVCEMSTFGHGLVDDLETKQYVSIVNKFIKTCSDIIGGFRGYFSKYVGDSVIGIFPLEYIENAIEAAVEIQRLIGQVRDKAAADVMSPEQVLFVSIGIAVGEFKAAGYEDEADKLRSMQEKTFFEFFGGGANGKQPTYSPFPASKNPGYELFEGGGLEVAIKLRKSTAHYRVPVLMSEHARNEYVLARRKTLGLHPYPQDAGTPIGPSFSTTKATSTTNTVVPSIPSSRELELSLVGTVKVTEDIINVYAPSKFVQDSEPFRNGASTIGAWIKELDRLRFGSL